MERDGTMAGNDARGSRGNALFLILIAVALFALLGYAVTTSGRGGGDVGREQRSLAVAQMLGYMANMEQVVTRLRLVHGCALTQLDFQSPEWTTPADYVNDLGSPPANGECAVFLQEGGALAWQAPPAILQVNGGVEYGISALIQVPGVGTDAGGGAGKELAVYARVPKDVCLAVNDKYGIPNPSGDPPGVSASLTIPAGLSAFDGDFPFTIGNIGASFTNKVVGCFRYTVTTGTYTLYTVLAPR